jgi:RNase P subunit RPR2
MLVIDTPNPYVAVVCRHCNALLVFRPDELRLFTDQMKDDTYAASCDACGHETWIIARIVEGTAGNTGGAVSGHLK